MKGLSLVNIKAKETPSHIKAKNIYSVQRSSPKKHNGKREFRLPNPD